MREFLAQSGTRVYDLQGRELGPDQLATLNALRTGASVRQQEEVIRRPDGSSLPVIVNAIALDLHLFPYLSGAREWQGDPMVRQLALVVLQDVSALKDAECLKDEFIALAAHELRNPIAALSGYAHMLVPSSSSGSASGSASGNRGGKRRAIPRAWRAEAADAVTQASTRLAALTDDLLDATRLHANRLALRPEPTELCALVRRVVRRAQVTTEHHSLSVEAPSEPVIVDVDGQRVEQVLTNVLSNAIKYSPDGGDISVAVRVHTRGNAVDADLTATMATMAAPKALQVVRVSVRDAGLGIPADEQAQIFGRFVRAGNARQLGVPGTGLGLYLSRELIERQGGRIWFESVEGSGTTFTVEVPRWTDPEEAGLVP